MENIKIKRIVAYIIDIFIVSGLVTLLSMINVLRPNESQLKEKYQELLEYEESLTNNTIEVVNIKEISNVTLEIAKLEIVTYITEVVVIILYFTLFPLLFEGQTIGKKLLKLKIVDQEEHKPKFINLLLRSLLIPVSASFLMYNTLGYILIIISAILLKGTTYMTAYAFIYIIATIFCYADILKMISNKDNESLHDKITKTKVIKC